MVCVGRGVAADAAAILEAAPATRERALTGRAEFARLAAIIAGAAEEGVAREITADAVAVGEPGPAMGRADAARADLARRAGDAASAAMVDIGREDMAGAGIRTIIEARRAEFLAAARGADLAGVAGVIADATMLEIARRIEAALAARGSAGDLAGAARDDASAARADLAVTADDAAAAAV